MALSKLSGDEQCIIFVQLCNTLDPGVAMRLVGAFRPFVSCDCDVGSVSRARPEPRPDAEELVPPPPRGRRDRLGGARSLSDDPGPAARDATHGVWRGLLQCGGAARTYCLSPQLPPPVQLEPTAFRQCSCRAARTCGLSPLLPPHRSHRLRRTHATIHCRAHAQIHCRSHAHGGRRSTRSSHGLSACMCHGQPPP